MLTSEKSLALRPIFSETFLLGQENPLFNEGTFIYRITNEERTTVSPDYLNINRVKLIRIVREEEESFVFYYDNLEEAVNLTDEESILGFLNKIDKESPLYIDITGLSHNTWAIILKRCYYLRLNIKILYAEPLTYNSPPNQPYKYALSLKINPIKPIPSFAVLSDIGTDNFSFIALLGFEKRRFELMITTVDPPQHSVYPIVGVPGFQLAFPFETYIINKKKLLDNELYQNVKFAAASCPFRLYYLLYDISLEARSDLYKIALIGTKPHALGAVIFYLCSGLSVELLYDHPKRKEGRSSGAFKLHVYHVDHFWGFLQEE